MNRYRAHRSYVALLVSALLISVAACGDGGFSPTEPALGTPTARTGSAVVTGEVTTTDGDVKGIRVSVDGSTFSDRTNRRGGFRLPGVPAGDVTLRFERSGVTQSLTLPGVANGQHVRIDVSLGADDARVISRADLALVEFDGVVISADAAAGTLGLEDGSTLVVAPHPATWWDSGGDLLDVASIEAALTAGQTVRAEGAGAVDESTGQVVASAIKVEVEEAEAEERDFAGQITAVDLGAGTFMVDDGTVAVVDGDTSFESAALNSLVAIADALTAGRVVNVEGEGTVQEDDSVLASKVEAEFVEADFDGLATSTDGTSFQVDGGVWVRTDGSTVWVGELSSTAEIATALAAGDTVEVDGEGYLLDDGSIYATSVNATVEEAEDEDEGEETEEEEGEGEEDPVEVDFSLEIASILELMDLTRTTAATEGLKEQSLRPLLVSLEVAMASLERGNGIPAANQIGAYINKVNALVKSRKLDAVPAQTLIAAAGLIVDAIGAKI